MSEREGIKKTLFIAYASTGVAQITNQLFLFLVLRYLPIKSVGIYSWAAALAMIVGYISDFGLPAFLVGELSAHQRRSESLKKMVIAMRVPVIGLAVTGLAVWWFVYNPESSRFWTLAIILLSFLLQTVDGGLGSWLQARNKQLQLNLLSLIIPIGRLFGFGLLLLGGKAASVTYVALVGLGSQIVSTVVFLSIVKGRQQNPPETGVSEEVSAMFRNFRKRGFGLSVMYALNVAQLRLDWLLVSSLISTIALANYSIAVRISEFGSLMAGVWARTSFPWISASDAKEEGRELHLSLLRRAFILFSCALGMAIAFVANPLLSLFFAGKYAASHDIVTVVSLGIPLFMLNLYYLYDFVAGHREQLYNIILVVATVVQASLNIVLLPRYGVQAGSLVLVGTAVVIHVAQMLVLGARGTLNVVDIVRQETVLLLTIGIVLLLDVPTFTDASVKGASLVVIITSGLFILYSATERGLMRHWLRNRWEGR